MSSLDPHHALRQFAHDPRWFLHQLDWAAERALLVELTPEAIARASFLDERALAGVSNGFWAPLEDVFAAAAACAGPSPDAIFHIGHCGSTLLSRQLAQWPGVMGLREPLILRALADWREDDDDAAARLSPERWQAWFARALGVLARRAAGVERVIVKATSNCNGLIAPWLSRDESVRAVALWIPLEEYLATILKSPDSRADCRRFAPARFRYLASVLGADAPSLGACDTATIVALGWLAELLRFETLRQMFGERLRLVEFGALLAGREQALAEVAAHFALPESATALRSAWSPAVEGRYAKATEHAYDAAARAADLAESRRRFGAEIATAMTTTRALVTRHPVLAGLASRLDR